VWNEPDSSFYPTNESVPPGHSSTHPSSRSRRGFARATARPIPWVDPPLRDPNHVSVLRNLTPAFASPPQ
jgi:hypothetical protein